MQPLSSGAGRNLTSVLVILKRTVENSTLRLPIRYCLSPISPALTSALYKVEGKKGISGKKRSPRRVIQRNFPEIGGVNFTNSSSKVKPTSFRSTTSSEKTKVRLVRRLIGPEGSIPTNLIPPPRLVTPRRETNNTTIIKPAAANHKLRRPALFFIVVSVTMGLLSDKTNTPNLFCLINKIRYFFEISFFPNHPDRWHYVPSL